MTSILIYCIDVTGADLVISVASVAMVTSTAVVTTLMGIFVKVVVLVASVAVMTSTLYDIIKADLTYLILIAIAAVMMTY